MYKYVCTRVWYVCVCGYVCPGAHISTTDGYGGWLVRTRARNGHIFREAETDVFNRKPGVTNQAKV